MGKDSSAGKAAVRLLDNHIDQITAPLLEPILEMYAEEGAPFLSSFKKETPLVEEIQNYVAGPLKSRHSNITATDEYKTLAIHVEGEFAHAKPVIKASDDGK